MARPGISAGILLYRSEPSLEVLLVLPGGPYWRRRDAGSWQIPKGAIEAGETPELAARREFAEELGLPPPDLLRPLGEIRQKGGKRVIAFAAAGALDPAAVNSNLFEIEWPPRSGRMRRYPEVERAAWYGVEDARTAMLPSQSPLIDRLVALLAPPGPA